MVGRFRGVLAFGGEDLWARTMFISSTMLVTPSFCMMWLRWSSIVRWERWRIWAIWRLLFPSMMNFRTRCSARVRGSEAGRCCSRP